MTAAVSADIIELRNVSKLDFNGKHELLARGRPTPTLHELLRLSALAILSIESQRLCKLKTRKVLQRCDRRLHEERAADGFYIQIIYRLVSQKLFWA